jgi:signal transduction histidine kinase
MSDLLELYQQTGFSAKLAELDSLVQPTLSEAASVLGFARAFVALFDLEAGVFQDAVGINVPEGLLDEFPPSMTHPFRLGKTLIVGDALRDSRLPQRVREQCVELGILSFAALPLLPASAILFVSKDRPVTEEELTRLMPIADHLTAIVVERLEARQLRESGERHAVEKEWLWWMLNTVQDPVLLLDEGNQVILHNLHAERLFLVNPDDSDGKRRAVQLNNVLLSATLSRFALDQGLAFGRDLTLVDPIEGNELLFEVICQTATNLRTGGRGLVAVLKDVTDLRRADEDLRRSLSELQAAGEGARRERDRLDLIVENVADPIVVTDPSGQIIRMNQTAERLLQVPSSTATEQVQAVYLANGAKLSLFLGQLLLDPSVTRRGEIQIVDPETDEPLVMSVSATEARDDRGNPTAIVSVLHDLTRIRELEERRVQQHLFDFEKQAAVGRLAATVAHEINNPLEAIKNALYLAVSSLPPNDPNRQYLEIASKETVRVSGIIRQMLGFYRSTAERVPTDVNRILEDALALLLRQLRQHQIVVRFDPEGELPPVLASPDQIKQVFLNLILNAQEAMPRGGTLSIATRLSSEGEREFLAGRFIVVQIRDTGVGIADEDMPRIFEPFYSTKTETKGTGLGLWVSLGIVQNHGGQIKVRSRAGRGTTFTVALPPIASG